MGIDIGILYIDERCSVAALSGRLLGLRPLDLKVLALLARDPGRAVSRRALSDTLWGPESDVDPRAVDTSVARIRKAFDGRGDAVVTVRRIGYRLDPDRLTE